jgi:hypothetical protein
MYWQETILASPTERGTDVKIFPVWYGVSGKVRQQQK